MHTPKEVCCFPFTSEAVNLKDITIAAKMESQKNVSLDKVDRT